MLVLHLLHDIPLNHCTLPLDAAGAGEQGLQLLLAPMTVQTPH
jgi:hypothetical protein